MLLGALPWLNSSCSHYDPLIHIALIREIVQRVTNVWLLLDSRAGQTVAMILARVQRDEQAPAVLREGAGVAADCGKRSCGSPVDGLMVLALVRIPLIVVLPAVDLSP